MSLGSRSADRRRRWAMAAALSWPALAAAPAAGQLTAALAREHPSAAKPKLTLGALRRDGLLVPFASFDGDDWSIPWPDETREVPLPITVKDVPPKWWGAPGPRAPWTAWLLDGRTKALALTGITRVPVFCGARLAIRTDYRGEAPGPAMPTMPKDGLAIAGDAGLLPIESVGRDTADARAMTEALTDSFNRAEIEASEAFTRWKHPLAPEVRARLPIELEAFYRAPVRPGAPVTVSYVEAVRRFPPGPRDDGCGLITYVFGWVTSRNGKPSLFDVGGRIAYCDRANVPFMLPFGRLELRDDSYWIYQMSSWRDEVYSVVRVRPGHVEGVVSYSGGFCPR